MRILYNGNFSFFNFARRSFGRETKIPLRHATIFYPKSPFMRETIDGRGGIKVILYTQRPNQRNPITRLYLLMSDTAKEDSRRLDRDYDLWV
jgi:hypothetical protein